MGKLIVDLFNGDDIDDAIIMTLNDNLNNAEVTEVIFNAPLTESTLEKLQSHIINSTLPSMGIAKDRYVIKVECRRSAGCYQSESDSVKVNLFDIALKDVQLQVVFALKFHLNKNLNLIFNVPNEESRVMVENIIKDFRSKNEFSTEFRVIITVGDQFL